MVLLVKLKKSGSKEGSLSREDSLTHIEQPLQQDAPQQYGAQQSLEHQHPQEQQFLQQQHLERQHSQYTHPQYDVLSFEKNPFSDSNVPALKEDPEVAALADVFAKSEIAATQEHSVHLPVQSEPEPDHHSPKDAEATRDVYQDQNTESNVDVYFAPAVLGHRWVRSRSSTYVVEKPERLKATLLGVAALISKSYAVQETAEDVNSNPTEDVQSLSTKLELLAVSSRKSRDISMILSRAARSLAYPDAALQYIHAHQDEVLQIDDIGDPPEYLASRASDSGRPFAWPRLPTSYTSYLDTLCSAAPFSEPPVPAKAAHRGTAFEDDQRRLLNGSQPCEVPVHLPSGDLYLCGPEVSSTGGRELSYFGPAEDAGISKEKLDTVGQGGDEDVAQAHRESELPKLPGSLPEPPYKEEVEVNILPSTPKAQTDSGPRAKEMHDEEEWLRQGSRGAIEASLGTCCAALDRIVGVNGPDTSLLEHVDLAQLGNASIHSTASSSDSKSSKLTLPSRRAFVLARPPGHHCTATKPSGFCWVNNVAVMAAHAYEKHGIDRIAILDFDLHHGDGTQSIAWRINAETVAKDAERQAKIKAWHADAAPKQRKSRKSGISAREGIESQQRPVDPDFDRMFGKRGLKVSYGSLHDIESFPCEDGDRSKVSDASICVAGAHGQWIWNVHLEAHADRAAFLAMYSSKYTSLLTQARRFFSETDSDPEKSLIIISAGFDACVHEHPGMQRHGKSVPTEFYTMFTRDTVRLAEEICAGKCISVLEGGYSDRALTSGVMAHIAGLASLDVGMSEFLCQTGTLTQLERLAKSAGNAMVSSSAVSSVTPSLTRRKPELSARDPQWLKYTLEAFKRLQECCGKRRVTDVTGSATAPATPFGVDAMWRSPRETRATKPPQSAKASPVK